MQTVFEPVQMKLKKNLSFNGSTGVEINSIPEFQIQIVGALLAVIENFERISHEYCSFTDA